MSSQILTDLPFETFWLILKSLNSCGRDINALAQVNRNLYALLNPYLYRLSVHIPPNPAIAWGAYHGREATVREFLEQGSWKGSTFGAGKSPEPITLAALAGHANTVELLLNHGAQPMKRWDWNDNGTKQTGVTDWNYTESDPIRDWPPWTAALVRDPIDDSFGNLEIVRFLVDSGSPVNDPDLWGHTPLVYAADAGNVETVQLLLNRGADPDPGIPWPLRLAAEKRHVKAAELLLERIDVRRKITSGDDQLWLLYSAATCGFVKIVPACLDAGGNVGRRLFIRYFPFLHADDESSRNGYYSIPLDWARLRGHSAVVRLLENARTALWPMDITL
ncbi:hypothetical protein N7534_006171 [Penicillium rubens]|nr:hypothetical protein N7534_006171 [Penicillium rubens]